MGNLRCGGVAVWGVALCGSHRVGELQCGGVVVWESCGVCELLRVAVAVFSNWGLWGFWCVSIVVWGSQFGGVVVWK